MKKSKALRWLWQNSKGCRSSILLLSLVCIVYSLVQLSFVTASKTLIDIATRVTDGSFKDGFLLIVCLLAIQLILQIVIDFMNTHAFSRLDISLKTRTFRSIIGKEYLAVSKYRTGDLISRLSSDVNVISSGVVQFIPSVFLLLTSLVGAMIMMWEIEPIITIIVLVAAPFVAIGARLYSGKYKSLHKRCQQADGDTNSFILEMLRNLIVVKSFSAEKVAVKHTEALQEKSYKLRLRRVAVSVLASAAVFIIFNAGYYFALAYGAYAIAIGTLTFGELTAVLQLVGKIQSPFKEISGLIPQLFSVIASTERILEVEEIATEESYGELVDDFDEIRLENVSFSYSDDASVSNVDFSVKKGEFAVIAGESGAGKSTVIKLLLGLFKQNSGELYVTKDGKRYNIGTNTRRLFAYVPQGNMIFAGTIRENIAFARENATDEEVEKATRIAQIWDFVSNLEDGLDTKIGENGLGVSEGQAQRISIARAVLYDAPVLLLDEATSALDADTENALLRDLRAMTEKTCIIVSHRSAAFEICDKVCEIKSIEERI